MRKIFGGVFLFFFFVATTAQTAKAAAFHPYFGWRTLETEHFAIHYSKDLEALARKAAKYLEEAHEKLSPKYQWKPWGQTQVILTDQFDDSNGMASPLPYNWLLLRVVPPDPESALANYDDWLKTLVTHEYTHTLHLDAYHGIWHPFRWILGKLVSPVGMTPTWVKEGMATLEETVETEGGRGRASYSEMLLRTAIMENKFPTIDRADGVHWQWPSSQIPYIFGVKFWQYLREQYGEEKLQEFNRRVERSLAISMINGHARRTFGKSFYKLWKQWQVDLKEKYARQEVEIEKKGLTPTEIFLSDKEASFYLPTFSKDGKKLAYVTFSPKKAPAIWLYDWESGKKEKIASKIPSQMSFSPDGRFLSFSAMTLHQRYYFYYDLFQIDLSQKKKKAKRLTRGERARDPDYSPDGSKIIFVASDRGTDQIKLFDRKTKQITTLLGLVKPFTQFAHLRYSPDGSKIALIRFQPGSRWELCLLGISGKFLGCGGSRNVAIESRPAWSPDGSRLLFSSDPDGIFNLYAYDWKNRKLNRLTHAKTGFFQPALSHDGTLLARYYHGGGYDIRKVPYTFKESRQKIVVRKHKKAAIAKAVKNEKGSDDFSGTPKKYNALSGSLFLPRYVLPGLYTLDNGLLLTAATGSFDPLRYHHWVGGLTYRTDASHLGYFASYSYLRFLPSFGGGIDSSAVDFGNLTFTATGNTYHFYEERVHPYVFFSIPLGQKQAIGASYSYEDRKPITRILANEAAALNLGIFSGFNVNYIYGERQAFPASISPTEKGRKLRLALTVTDSAFGSARTNEQKIFFGDYREYLPLGGNNVLALRMAGGIAFGDRIFPGTFSLGGSLGEGTLAGLPSTRYFSLRGLPVSTLTRDRAMLMSAEFRLPLVSPQRGIGTWPIFLNNFHLGLFADYGDAWDVRDTRRTKNNFTDFFDDFFLGVGLETRADFVIGHGLPLTWRLGYAIIVANRARLGNLSDPFLGTRVKNGMLIMQWGTSF